MTWVANTLYESDESNNGDEASEMNTGNLCEENTIQSEDLSPMINDPDNLMMLPKWLQEKKDMIYPQNCIQTGQEVGHGQFGTVFKGKIVLGKSVYVDI